MFYYVGRTLTFAQIGQTPSNDVRGAAWLLLSCRFDVCGNIPEPLTFVSCPPGLGTRCDGTPALQYGFESVLGPSKYAEAIALSYQLEDAVAKEAWDQIDLSLTW